MSFVSFNFAVFLAVGLLVFHFCPARWRLHVLLALSAAFYATWTPWHMAVLFATVAVVYAAALLVERSKTQGRQFGLTALTVAALVMLLAAFKCSQSLVAALVRGPAQDPIGIAALLVAPLGLSYYLFKLIGYLLDVYWERLPAQRNLAVLTCYAAFFPQIVSGPIQRADDFFGQVPRLQISDPQAFIVGLRRILFGLFKKVVVADQLALVVAQIHGNVADRSCLELLVGAYAFALQIYADFSGVTDIAIGIGLLFGIKGPENFDRPFFARNIQEFWRKWHMSLTSWLTDYLFLPLRMSLRRLGDVGLALAILINLIAVGVWHGPRWTYLLFGCINGVFVAVSVFTIKRRNTYFRRHPRLTRIREFAAPLLTFHLTVFALIFFQSSSLSAALTYIERLLSFASQAGVPPMRLDWGSFGLNKLRLLQALGAFVAMEMVNWGSAQPRWTARFTAAPRILRWSLYYAVVVMVIFTMKGKTSFIYAKF